MCYAELQSKQQEVMALRRYDVLMLREEPVHRENVLTTLLGYT